jgi:hypothetical protein
MYFERKQQSAFAEKKRTCDTNVKTVPKYLRTTKKKENATWRIPQSIVFSVHQSSACQCFLKFAGPTRLKI